MKEKQHNHRYGYANIFNVELHKIAKKVQQGKEIKWDLFLLTVISSLVIPYIRKELKILLSFKQILDQNTSMISELERDEGCTTLNVPNATQLYT